MKYYIIAGEASGDLHAANLVKQLKQLDTPANIRAWGGDLLQQQGANVVKHYRDLAFMGFIEVVQNLRTILSNISFCKEDIMAFKPDVLILVDYPGFNLRIAKWAKQQGIKVIYYISPQVWAWKESRVAQIKQNVDLMLVILPFERDFYAKHNYNVQFVGHPLLDAIEDNKKLSLLKALPAGRQGVPERSEGEGFLPATKKYIALLPGSRKQEISIKLPIMLSVIPHFTDYEFIVAAAPSQPAEFYNELIGTSGAKLVSGETYSILANAHAALVTSGTATLETALFNVPEVVCYKGSPVSYQLAKWLIKVKYISLVNLILDKPAITELIQHELTTENIVTELTKLINDTPERKQVLTDYKVLKEKLGGQGASARAAGIIFDFVTK